MNVFVASPAERHAVGNIVAEIGMILPRSLMVCLDVTLPATFLALVVVSFINAVSPLTVLVGIPFAVSVGLAGGGIAAWLAAILNEVSARLLEGRPTVFAHEHRGRIECVRTGSGARLAQLLGAVNKRGSADHALVGATRQTEDVASRGDAKRLAASFALPDQRKLSGRLGNRAPVLVFPARLILRSNDGRATRMGTRDTFAGLIRHGAIVPHTAPACKALQRMKDLGLDPQLAED